ncbi:MAG: acetylglutamate kinase [Dissulfurispiraceae bacterium]|jgi:acetylglutamate kinase|nr:acetylglutamate kinase [Dissulfurispiraceae bacterium]
MKRLIEKANALTESLPYIKKFYGKTFVIKYGGAAQVKEDLKSSFASDIVLLNLIGIRTVIVHGGGPRISDTMKRMGKEPVFVHGQRITDEETMDIVEMVLGGLINKEIVALINSHGGKAVGLSGKDGGLILAKKKMLRKSSSQDDENIDIGLVGEVEYICPDLLYALEREGFIPVISPIGAGSRGETFNVNADDVAASVAASVKAEKFILLTDVAGVNNKKGEIISTIHKKEIKKLIDEDVVSGGMLPKVQACKRALDGGVGKAHIVDGRMPHCLLLEIFTDQGIGTEIVE